MTKQQAFEIQRQVEAILKNNGIHFKIELVRSPDLKFINIEASIKITKN